VNVKAAAAKLAAGELERLTLKVPPATRRALKARAAAEGISVAAYFVRLARRDGVDVAEMAGGADDE
jgi:uncharacterized protein (DUF1778 family)